MSINSNLVINSTNQLEISAFALQQAKIVYEKEFDDFSNMVTEKLKNFKKEALLQSDLSSVDKNIPALNPILIYKHLSLDFFQKLNEPTLNKSSEDLQKYSKVISEFVNNSYGLIGNKEHNFEQFTKFKLQQIKSSLNFISPSITMLSPVFYDKNDNYDPNGTVFKSVAQELFFSTPNMLKQSILITSHGKDYQNEIGQEIKEGAISLSADANNQFLKQVGEKISNSIIDGIDNRTSNEDKVFYRGNDSNGKFEKTEKIRGQELRQELGFKNKKGFDIDL